jgi:hypothetical protein
MMNEWSYAWEASYMVPDGHKFVWYAAVTETRNKLANVCNRRVNNQLSIDRQQTRISCSLLIKMTDIIIFFEFLLSRLWDLFSFIYHSISKSVLHTIYFVSNIPMFAFRTSIFRNSVIWYNSFRTSILYLTNIRFISYGHPLNFFPNIRWRTEMSIPNIRSLSYDHPFYWLRTSVKFSSEHLLTD